jgi:hypothetical protein
VERNQHIALSLLQLAAVRARGAGAELGARAGAVIPLRWGATAGRVDGCWRLSLCWMTRRGDGCCRGSGRGRGSGAPACPGWSSSTVPDGTCGWNRLPTEEFRQYQTRVLPRAMRLGSRVSDPERAQQQRLARDRRVTADAVRTARQCGIEIIGVDGGQDAAAVADTVAGHFRPHLPISA